MPKVCGNLYHLFIGSVQRPDFLETYDKVLPSKRDIKLLGNKRGLTTTLNVLIVHGAWRLPVARLVLALSGTLYIIRCEAWKPSSPRLAERSKMV